MAHFKDEDEMQESARPGAHQHALHASTSEAVTNNVRVEVESQYAAEQSQPFQMHWFFHYTVRITNVGEQPVLAPGESFQYTSGCPLKTSTGLMRGTYQMVTEDGDHFDVEIAPFQ